MIHLRRFRDRDLTRLYELDQSCFAQDIAYSMADLKYFLSHPRCLSWVAEADTEKLAGFLIVERAHRNQNMVGHVITIDVDREMRRRGVGRLLLETR